MRRGSSSAREAGRLRQTVASVFFGLVVAGHAIAGGQYPLEPEGYRLDDYRSPTPATVAGGTVLDTEAARALWADGAAIWIDVLPAPRRPATLPASALWMPLPHRDIPGSVWLPDVGRGLLSPDLEVYFREHLEALTNGRRDAPLAFYCLAECWMSWNAAKRAAAWGYTRVHWYPEGTDGWEAAKLPMAEAEPVPGP